jgi:hypothetical protein
MQGTSGLKPKTTKGPVNTIVIDHGEMPSEYWPAPALSRIGSRSDSWMPAKMVDGEAASEDLTAVHGAYDCLSIVTGFNSDFSQTTESTAYQAMDIVIPGRYPYLCGICSPNGCISTLHRPELG